MRAILYSHAQHVRSFDDVNDVDVLDNSESLTREAIIETDEGTVTIYLSDNDTLIVDDQ